MLIYINDNILKYYQPNALNCFNNFPDRWLILDPNPTLMWRNAKRVNRRVDSLVDIYGTYSEDVSDLGVRK